MPHVNKKFRSFTVFFSHLNFSLSRKQRYEQKNHYVFAPLFILLIGH